MADLKVPNRRCRTIITEAGYYHDNWLVVQEGINYIVVRHKMTLDKKIITKGKQGKFNRAVDFTQDMLKQLLEEEPKYETI